MYPRILRAQGLFYIAVLVFLLGSCQVQAQESAEIKKIRAIYKEMNAAIANCNGQPDEPCGYFLNTVIVNKQSQPWRAVGTFTSEREFWYRDVEDSEEQEQVLRKVNVKTLRSNRTENEEFLYDEAGKLIFYYFKSAESAETLQEYRFYFQDGKLVDYLEKITPSEMQSRQLSEDDAFAVHEQGEIMIQYFQMTH